jgi:hypothetical protein
MTHGLLIVVVIALILGGRPTPPATEAQPATPLAERPQFTRGDTWTFSFYNDETRRETWTFLSERDGLLVFAHRTTSAQKEESSRGEILYTPDLAVVRLNKAEFFRSQAFTGLVNKRLIEYQPHDGRLQFPLTVGKAWATEFTERAGVREAPIISRARVTEYTSVTVPAGTFEAFKVETTFAPKRGDPVWRTEWFAPAVKFYVRLEYGTAQYQLVQFQVAR